MKNSPRLSTRLSVSLSAIILLLSAGCAEVEFRIGTPRGVRGDKAAAENTGMGKIIRLDPRFDDLVPKGAVI